MKIEKKRWRSVPYFRVSPGRWLCSLGGIYGPYCYTRRSAVWQWLRCSLGFGTSLTSRDIIPIIYLKKRP